MAIFSIDNVALRGVSACVPQCTVSNTDVGFINDKELQLLIRTVGVQQRRLVNKPTSCSDLCFESAEKLLTSLGWKPEEIEILIFVSQSRDYLLPCTAIILQQRLGLSNSALAFDIPLGCSGYTYGVSVISSMMSSCRFKRGLLLTGDLSTNVINPQGQKTFPLFGDAGTASAFEFEAGAKPMNFDAGSDGGGYRAIIMKGNAGAGRIDEKQVGSFDSSISTIVSNDLMLDGPKVFEFSITQVPQSIKKLLESNCSTSDIDYFIMHQANLLMNETIRKKCGFTTQQTPYSLQKFGNTSSASIPLTMVSEIKNELQNKTCQLLLTGFGVGLSWSTALLHTSNLIIPELIEYDK